MKRYSKFVISATFLALASSFTGSQVAHAGDYWTGVLKRACPEGALCMYDTRTRSMGKFFSNNPVWGRYKWDNRADRFFNNGNRMEVCVYAEPYYYRTRSNSHRKFYRGVQYSFRYIQSFRDRASSNKWVYGRSGC